MSTKTEDVITLIYIAGEVRSGTTVIDLLISNHEQVISVGELSNLEDYIDKKDVGRFANWECSCGKQVEKCCFWGKNINKFEKNTSKKINTKIRKINSKEVNKKIAKNCWGLISIIASNENKKYISDSSKTALQLSFLYATKNKNEIKVIFVIRDSRAVAYSKSNWNIKFNPDEKPSFIRHIVRWLITNISTINLLTKNNIEFIVLRYENFATNPDIALANIYTYLKFSFKHNCKQTLDINGKHTIAGTPNKSTFFNTPIKLDLRWKKEINFRKNQIPFIMGITCNFILNIYLAIKKDSINK